MSEIRRRRGQTQLARGVGFHFGRETNPRKLPICVNPHESAVSRNYQTKPPFILKTPVAGLWPHFPNEAIFCGLVRMPHLPHGWGGGQDRNEPSQRGMGSPMTAKRTQNLRPSA
jgi:hypothetical protein